MKSIMIFGMLGFAIYNTSVHAASSCDPSNSAVVCGLDNAEDLVRLAGTHWVVASHRNFEFVPPFKASFGPVMAVRIDTHEVRTLYPTAQSTADWDRKTYPDCPSPPRSISSHGLNVTPLGNQHYRLYVANHGNRQSVEIIDIAVHGEQIQSAWRGCILSPGKIFPNGLVPLPGGGVALSGFGVATWWPGQGWSTVRKIKGSNGVEASPDGRWIFVNDDDTKAVIRVPAKGQGEQKIVALDFLPDNLRWGDDGRLYVAGPYWPEGFAVEDCYKSPDCDIGGKVVQLDPDTLTTREVFRSDSIKGLHGGATTALRIGDSLWIGSAVGDRVAIITLKTQ
jgi:hypothetical protein